MFSELLKNLFISHSLHWLGTRLIDTSTVVILKSSKGFSKQDTENDTRFKQRILNRVHLFCPLSLGRFKNRESNLLHLFYEAIFLQALTRWTFWIVAKLFFKASEREIGDIEVINFRSRCWNVLRLFSSHHNVYLKFSTKSDAW